MGQLMIQYIFCRIIILQWRSFYWPQILDLQKDIMKALKKVNADYYVLLNSDVEVEPGWIEPVIALMESNERIAACQPKLLQFHNKNVLNMRERQVDGWITWVIHLRKEEFLMYVKKIMDNTIKLNRFSGQVVRLCSFGHRYFMNWVGLDEYFFAHQEEIDLCWRMQLAGYKIYSCPASVVYHVGGGTLPKGNSIKVF